MDSITALKEFLKTGFKGDVDDSDVALSKAGRDASLLEVRPKIVLFPKDADDIKAVVRFVHENKVRYPELSVTVRAAGTCMSGGPLNESVIVDITRYMRGIVSISKERATVLPGTFYRDLEPETLKLGSILPCYTASKNLNTLGGMIGNNSAGEKTLRYGKMENFIESLKIVLEDGNEYAVRPLSKTELDAKVAKKDLEGALYRKIWDIVSENAGLLAKAKPNVSKNSAGYYLWNVWDAEKQVFDLTRLIVGSQGTLGIVTEATIRLVPVEPVSKLFVIFMPSLSRLGDLVNDILPFSPESIESYDDSTMKLALKFLPDMARTMHAKNFLKLMWNFWPEALMALTGGMPKLVLLVEFSGQTAAAIHETVKRLEEKIRHYGFKMREARDVDDSEKYWAVRRESFNLLRKHVHGARTAPFVDDVIVPPDAMPDFLPKMRAILDEYKLLYTIAGHAGNGNFHIIPLMDMHDARNLKAIDEVSDKVYDLVLSYGGSITAEHNDGIIRTPYLAKMFGPEVMALFQKTKDAFDPRGIFNPGKKVGGTKAYMMSHISRA
ncbi:FAD-binding oxidoreductase [Candidatus Parcubacteria bacterium]|nr:FAD-binding oxidoreductase [Candidatus Parcubacteria bacterium]